MNFQRNLTWSVFNVTFGKDLYPCHYSLDPDLAKVENHNVKVLGSISIVSSFLSLIGSGSIITFAIHKRICRSAEVRPLFHLAVADFLLALFWMFGAISNFSTPIKNPVDAAIFCFSWQAVTESVHLMTFFLTVNYAASVYLNVKEKLDRLTRFDYPFVDAPKDSSFRRQFSTASYIISWILPIVLFVPFGFQMKEQRIMACQKCIILLDVPRPKLISPFWLYYGYIVLVVGLCLSIILILVFYFMVLKMYRRALPCFCTDRQRMMISSLASRVTLYVVVFLYCWSPALIIVASRLDLDRKDDETTVPVVKYFGLYVLQAMSAPLQGFLNSIVYGWSRKAFREATGPEGHHLISEGFTFTYGAAEYTPPSSLVSSTEYVFH